MLNRVRYFHAIVQYNSFTEAAERCNISQSAISQQIHSLEEEVGTKLFNREKRRISLTEAGEHFYRKTLVIVNDYDRLVKETQKIGNGENAKLRIGVLLTYGGEELQLAISEFTTKYPTVDVSIMTKNHEELYESLNHESVDIILSDQRRLFSNDAENVVVQKNHCWIEIARRNQIAALDSVDQNDLRNFPCILVANQGQEENETTYYRQTYGFDGDFIFAPTIKDARLMVVANRGFFPVDGQPILSHFDATIARVPFYKNYEPFTKNLCIFWKKDNSGYYIEDFAEMLENKFIK